MNAVDQLIELGYEDEPFAHSAKELHDLQIEAMNARLEAAVEAIPVVRQRAADASISKITSHEDLVPLLLSDSTYKSYPERLVYDRKWRSLGAWIDSVSIQKGAADFDPAGAETLDEWIYRLHDAGELVYASSGTTGKCSLYKLSSHDFDQSIRWYQHFFGWRAGAKRDQSYRFYGLFPTKGNYRGVHSFGAVSKIYAKPEHRNFLSDEPMLVDDINRLGRLRKDIAAGVATPSEIAEVEALSAHRQAGVDEGLGRLGRSLADDQTEPCMILATTAMHYSLMQAAQAAGCEPGLHPESVVFTAGGLKGAKLPADFQSQVEAFYGIDPSQYVRTYGMTELNTHMPACELGRYHCAPWIVPIVVDRTGERIVEPHGGVATGRAAFMDLSMDTRWAALLSGDRVTVDRDPCPCGRAGATVLPDIVRYVDLAAEDDKTTCAGTMDDYVRGSVEEQQ